jgi:ketosteroid isomerase-like protein
MVINAWRAKGRVGMAELEETVRRYYRTVDSLGSDATVALFSENAVYRRPGYDAICGRAALTDFYGGVRVIASGHHTVDDILIDGDRAAVRGRFHGVLRDGEEVDVGFADFLHYEADLIADRTTYFYQPSV